MSTAHPAVLDIHIQVVTDPDGSHPEPAPLLDGSKGLVKPIGETITAWLALPETVGVLGVHRVEFRYGGGHQTLIASDFQPEGDES